MTVSATGCLTDLQIEEYTYSREMRISYNNYYKRVDFVQLGAEMRCG